MEHREVCSAENKALLKGNHALVDAMDMRVIIKLFDHKHTAQKHALPGARLCKCKRNRIRSRL